MKMMIGVTWHGKDFLLNFFLCGFRVIPVYISFRSTGFISFIAGRLPHSCCKL